MLYIHLWVLQSSLSISWLILTTQRRPSQSDLTVMRSRKYCASQKVSLTECFEQLKISHVWGILYDKEAFLSLDNCRKKFYKQFLKPDAMSGIHYRLRIVNSKRIRFSQTSNRVALNWLCFLCQMKAIISLFVMTVFNVETCFVGVGV